MSNNLEKIRAGQGLTQTKLAKLAGISPQRLNYLEKVSLNANQALKFEDILDVNAFRIFGTDVLKLKIRDKRDKEELLDIIQNIEV